MNSKLSAVVVAAAILIAMPGQAGAEEKVRIVKKVDGSFLTNVAGSSVTQPPYIQVIRSKEGFDYTIAGFERMKNRITQRRINYVKKQFAGIDYKKHMLVMILSQPMDNFKMSLDKVSKASGQGSIEVKVSFRHKLVTHRIPPKKSIHYIMAAVPKSDLPVILQASEIVGKKNKKSAKIITVTGRLMRFSGGEVLQLVPVVIKRGSKNSYYIKGDQAQPLYKLVGKVVTLQGTVSRERNSPYEWDLEVKSVVKVY